MGEVVETDKERKRRSVEDPSEPEDQMAVEAKEEPAEVQKTVPYFPYYSNPYFQPNPYFYPYSRPYFFYYTQPAKEGDKEEAKEPQGSYFPFYFAKPTEDDKEEGDKKPEVEVVPGAHFPFAPFFYPPLTHFPAAKRIEKMAEVVTEVKVDQPEEPEVPKKEIPGGKTLSLPVSYHSYFPKFRYVQYKKEEKEAKKMKRSA